MCLLAKKNIVLNFAESHAQTVFNETAIIVPTGL